MRKSIHILIGLFVMPVLLSGQSREAFIKAAEDAFETKDYFSAMSYYAEALEFEKDVSTSWKAGEAARLFDAYTVAIGHYSYVVEESDSLKYPLATFYLGQMYQRQGKYDEAIDHYQLYISENDDSDSTKVGIARKEVEACSWAKNEVDNPKRNITTEKLEGNVNTPYSEFGGLNTESAFYFSSLRFVQPNDDHNPPRTFSKNLIKDFNGINIDTTIEAADTQHIAHTAFNGDETRMYFTLCEYLNDKDIRCDIYMRDRNRNGTWGEAKKLPEH
ncbi:MAG: tetratricopeptide repeat protein, partial [Saprospiraceae bacterium]|nr:tetratricopeptide repeat protein [Saprospiraceae bacterium]